MAQSSSWARVLRASWTLRTCQMHWLLQRFWRRMRCQCSATWILGVVQNGSAKRTGWTRARAGGQSCLWQALEREDVLVPARHSMWSRTWSATQLGTLMWVLSGFPLNFPITNAQSLSASRGSAQVRRSCREGSTMDRRWVEMAPNLSHVLSQSGGIVCLRGDGYWWTVLSDARWFFSAWKATQPKPVFAEEPPEEKDDDLM